MNNNTFTFLLSTLLVGFVGFKTLSKNTDIHFDKVDKIIEKDMYEEQLTSLSRDLIDDIINQVCLEIQDEYESISFDVCSCCSSCDSSCDSFFSFTDVVVDL